MKHVIACAALGALVAVALGCGKDSRADTRAFNAAKLYKLPIATLDGKPGTIGDYKGKTLLIVNVASKCGLTPQYETLEKLQRKYGKRGFTVLGFPCNQFGGQEPGSHKEIAQFCSRTYGVTFPMFEKVEVNGKKRHPIYKVLTRVEDAAGKAGDVQWNFEKFVISADGKSITRFRPRTVPDAPEVIAAIEAGLPRRK
jgi:glutathione peroxidase